MTSRNNPLIIRSCCCSSHLAQSERSMPLTSSNIIGRSNSTSSPRSDINVSPLHSLRSKTSSRVYDLGSQAETVRPYSPHTTSMMDGEVDNLTSRYIHLVNSQGSHVGPSCGVGGRGCATRRDRTLVKNRKSESCFDLVGQGRFLSYFENDRPPPSTAGRKFSSSMSTSGRESWSEAVPRPSPQRPSQNGRQSWNKNYQDDSKSVTAYLTPLQRKERELKLIKKEIAKLVDDVDERDSLILSLKYDMETDTQNLRDETERKIAEMEQAMKDFDKEKTEKQAEIKTLKTKLGETESSLAEVQLELSQEKEQFKDKYLDMYIKGQRAAAFEREEELEMLSSKKKEKVTARELARKLSRTETELAKWQTLRLEEAYSTPNKPDSSSEVTLNFLKDSFYHFITDPINSLQHFRAMVEIFKFSDEQIKAIRKSIGESKELRKILKRDQ